MAPNSRGTAQIPSQVHDFSVLPLRLPSTPSFPIDNITHYLYIRANAPKVPTEDTPRELFLVNVPVDTTETHIRALFAEKLGGVRVEEVGFEDARVGRGIVAPVVKKGKKRKRGNGDGGAEEGGEEVGLLPDIWDRELRRSGSTAVVRFVDRASAELALKEVRRAARAGVAIDRASKGTSLPPLGSTRYLTHHTLRYPSPTELQSSVDRYMTAFNAQEAARARDFARQRSEPDADGFITVTRGGRNGPARVEETRRKEEELKGREKKRVKDDFYRFQVRERMKERAKELVRGFEEDGRRVERMRGRGRGMREA